MYSPAFRYNLFVWFVCYSERSEESTSGMHKLTDPSSKNKKYFHFNLGYLTRATCTIQIPLCKRGAQRAGC